MIIDTNWLRSLNERLTTDPTDINTDDRKKFWNMVGVLKRRDAPEDEKIRLMASIREHLYLHRFGREKSLKVAMLLNTVAAVLLIYSVFAIYFIDIWLGTIISWIAMTIFAGVYVWIIDTNTKVTLFAIGLTLGLTVIIDLIFIGNEEIYVKYSSWLLFPVLPILYLHGRYVGALIAGIKIDGVNRDVFYLPTIKLNYESYLSARPDKRQWIFLCGGLGTVFTSTIMAILGSIYFDNPYLFIIPIVLFVAELLDFAGKAGKLSGGEFNHLRRERRIIGDWKASLEN